MFYRIRNNEIYDYANYEYAKDCLYTDLCTMDYFDKHREDYIIAQNQIVLNPELDSVLAQKRESLFKKDFFQTSLGWIRRKVSMQDGSVKDFLADLLLPIKAGLEIGHEVRIITYKTPDYSKEPTQEYMTSLQEVKIATLNFVKECLFQTVHDYGIEEDMETTGGNNGI